MIKWFLNLFVVCVFRRNCFEEEGEWNATCKINPLFCPGASTGMARTSRCRARTEGVGWSQAYLDCWVHWFHWNSGIKPLNPVKHQIHNFLIFPPLCLWTLTVDGLRVLYLLAIVYLNLRLLANSNNENNWYSFELVNSAKQNYWTQQSAALLIWMELANFWVNYYFLFPFFQAELRVFRCFIYYLISTLAYWLTSCIFMPPIFFLSLRKSKCHLKS